MAVRSTSNRQMAPRDGLRKTNVVEPLLRDQFPDPALRRRALLMAMPKRSTDIRQGTGRPGQEAIRKIAPPYGA